MPPNQDSYPVGTLPQGIEAHQHQEHSAAFHDWPAAPRAQDQGGPPLVSPSTPLFAESGGAGEPHQLEGKPKWKVPPLTPALLKEAGGAGESHPHGEYKPV